MTWRLWIPFKDTRFILGKLSMKSDNNRVLLCAIVPRLCNSTSLTLMLPVAYILEREICSYNRSRGHYSTGLSHIRPLTLVYLWKGKSESQFLLRPCSYFTFTMNIWLKKLFNIWCISVKLLPLLPPMKLNVNISGAMWLYLCSHNTSLASQWIRSLVRKASGISEWMHELVALIQLWAKKHGL